MCKKLLVFMLVLCFVGSAAAITEYSYDPIAGYRGSTCDPPQCTDCTGLKFTTGGFYAGFWTTCGGVYPCGMTGWSMFDIPALGETIIKAELHVTHGSSQGSTAVVVRANYVSDDTWTPTTITASHPATSDYVDGAEGAGQWSGVYDKVLDVTSWFGAGKESLTGGEKLSVQFNEIPAYTPSGPGDYDGYYGASLSSPYLVITTPEPATIALLGLGGLTLLRRKR